MTNRAIGRVGIWLLGAAAAGAAWAQGNMTSGAATQVEGVSVLNLFRQSFDFFTILIIAGSVAAVAIIVRCAIVLRRSVILPDASTATIRQFIAERQWPELQRFVSEDSSMLSRVLRETLPRLRNNPGVGAVGEAADDAADAEATRLSREVEWLGVLGNLGPLLGLVGTVWGMIIAFTGIGSTGGQAAASMLSIGIAKALFHTFLGLLLAIPSLLAYGVFRERLDRLTAEGAALASDLAKATAIGVSGGAPPASPTTGGPNAQGRTSPTAAV